ncbi:DUF559 domain-containing protein [Frondihabitans peucedani]|uniref:DUF559 domain-containing protein n=1 Tax=Frondihabitans peucedani TaxID=598626 RepID=A0ABP8DY31_9MICO
MTSRAGSDRAAPPPQHPAGTVVVSKNPKTSKTEQDVRDRLTAAGLQLHPGRSAIQCGFDEERRTWPVLTPDYLLRESRVCVEFDSGYTHRDEEASDRRRNALLNDVGWTVVRLRTGGLPALGPYDVTTDTSSFTVGAITALVESIEDAVAGRPGVQRHIDKAPARVRKRSRLGSLAADKHVENAVYSSWTLDSGRVLRLTVMAGGHFLGAPGGGWRTPAFVIRLGLDRLPRSSWRGNLEALLETMPEESLAPTSRFPWGDDLFTGEHADVQVESTFNVGASAHIGSTTLPAADGFDDDTMHLLGGGRLALHPEARDAGWRFADVRQLAGKHGPFQKYLLLRDGPRGGLWAGGPE